MSSILRNILDKYLIFLSFGLLRNSLQANEGSRENKTQNRQDAGRYHLQVSTTRY